MVTITLKDDAAAYVLMVMQARHDAATQRELHAHSRGDSFYKDPEASITFDVVSALANVTPKAGGTPEKLEDHPDYCAEHGGHLRDSPACEMAKLRARVQGANPQQ